MTRKRLKLTPFARFLIVMVFAAPVAYLAASYYNGEDGIQNLKELLGIGTQEKKEVPAVTDRPAIDAPDSDTATLNLQELQEAYSQLKQENAELKETLRKQDLEIQELKREIRLLKGSESGN